MFTKSVTVDYSFKMVVILHQVRSENQLTVLLGYLIISSSQLMLDATVRAVGSNFVVHQDVVLVHIAFRTIQLLCSAKRPTSFNLSYSPVMV